MENSKEDFIPTKPRSVELPVTPEELFGKKKLYPFGGSYAVIVPKAWVDIFCKPISGIHWVTVDVETGIITIRPWKDEE